MAQVYSVSSLLDDEDESGLRVVSGSFDRSIRIWFLARRWAQLIAQREEELEQAGRGEGGR